MRRSRLTERGFTLIEAVMVIAITGVVIAMVAIFIVPATTAYFASAARAQLWHEYRCHGPLVSSPGSWGSLPMAVG